MGAKLGGYAKRRDVRPTRVHGGAASLAAAVAGLLLTTGPAKAQFAPPIAPPLAPDVAKRAFEQAAQLYGDPVHPNLSGVWLSGASNFSWVDYGKTELPLTPRYAAIFKIW